MEDVIYAQNSGWKLTGAHKGAQSTYVLLKLAILVIVVCYYILLIKHMHLHPRMHAFSYNSLGTRLVSAM